VLVGDWVAAILYLVEFLADKIPVVDSVWDAAHTFIRVPAAAVLAASAFAHFDPIVRVIALLAGRTLALGSKWGEGKCPSDRQHQPGAVFQHTAQYFRRHTDYRPYRSGLFHPVAILLIIFLFVFLLIWLGPKILRSFRRMLWQLGNMVGRAGAPTKPNLWASRRNAYFLAAR